MAEPSAIQAQSLGCIKIARQLETALLKSLNFGGHIKKHEKEGVFSYTLPLKIEISCKKNVLFYFMLSDLILHHFRLPVRNQMPVHN